MDKIRLELHVKYELYVYGKKMKFLTNSGADKRM